MTKPTQEQVIAWVQEAMWTGIYSQWISPTERKHLTVPVTEEQIKTALTLAYEAGRKDENEACAKVCEELGYYAKHGGWGCADAIRERGENND